MSFYLQGGPVATTGPRPSADPIPPSSPRPAASRRGPRTPDRTRDRAHTIVRADARPRPPGRAAPRVGHRGPSHEPQAPPALESRRSALARRFVALEAMEPRSLITESLGILTSGIGIPRGHHRGPPRIAPAVMRAQGRPSAVAPPPGPSRRRSSPPRPPSGGGSAPVSASSADSVWADLATRSAPASAPVASGPASNAHHPRPADQAGLRRRRRRRADPPTARSGAVSALAGTSRTRTAPARRIRRALQLRRPFRLRPRLHLIRHQQRPGDDLTRPPAGRRPQLPGFEALGGGHRRRTRTAHLPGRPRFHQLPPLHPRLQRGLGPPPGHHPPGHPRRQRRPSRPGREHHRRLL